jgi:RHS repeat-associated protein
MTSATYDGDGLRASATNTPSGGSPSTQNYVWNTATQTGMPELLMDSSNAYVWAQGLAPAEQVNLDTGTVSYLVTDLAGSVRGVISSTGALTASTSYDAWGNPETPGGLTAYTPFGFEGGYTDPDGLIYLVNRYYDPNTGQFLSVDPDLSQTLEPYAYAGDNPVTSGDPTGLSRSPGGGGGYTYPESSKFYIPPLSGYNPWPARIDGTHFAIPIRIGNKYTSFGWDYFYKKHDIYNWEAIGMAITYGGTAACPSKYGTLCRQRRVMLYNKPLYDDGEGTLWIANLEVAIKFVTKRDGLPLGVATAYCPGQPEVNCGYNGKTFWLNTFGVPGVYAPGRSKYIGYVGPAADYPPPE